MKNCIYSFIIIIVLFFVAPIQKTIAQCTQDDDCHVCDIGITITSISGGSIVNGSTIVINELDAGDNGIANSPLVVDAGQCGELTITVELDFQWTQGINEAWIHGVSFLNSGNWVVAEGIIIPPNPGWIFQNSITGVCSNNTYGAGYYWDPVGTNCADSGNHSYWNGTDCQVFYNPPSGFCEGTHAWLTDGDPSDNIGIDCENGGCPQFGFELTYCPPATGNATENIEFYLTEDGETGGWALPYGCNYLLSFPININSAGIQDLDDQLICEGECVTLDAGSGCDNYEWSTGEMTQSILVCPTSTTTYSVSVGSASGCELIQDVIVATEFCCEAEAGALTGGNLCPDNTFDAMVSGYNADPGYDQYFIVTDLSGNIIDIISGDEYPLYSDICQSFQIVSFNNHSVEGIVPAPMIGNSINTFDCINNCCDIEIEQVVFEDTVNPVFPSELPDITLDCLADLMPMDSLAYTDNCIGNGKVWGTESGIVDYCSGGLLIRQWEVTDLCDNTSTSTQNITILPFIGPDFEAAPADLTLSCSASSSIPVPDLMYDNGQSGGCRQVGTVPGILSGSSDICGGNYTINWTFTDTCGTVITESQNITVDPAPEAMIISPPSDMTLDCSSVPMSYPDLDYSNGETGICEISGTLNPVVTPSYDECGGTIEIEWSTVDDCNRDISHNQTITVTPATQAAFINPPADMTIDCDQIPLNGVDLDYTNNETGLCEISGTIIPFEDNQADKCGGTITYLWEFTDDCGRFISATQVLTVNPADDPTLINPPNDITVDCDNFPAPIADIQYTNGLTGSCEIAGQISGIETPFDVCTGIITRDWSGADECGTPLSWQQVITVDPIPVPMFDNMPPDITVECSNFPGTPGPLTYTNNGSGACLIDGSVNGVQSGTFDACGGVVTNTWDVITICGDPLSYTQIITVNPAPSPAFINVPTDITVECDAIPNAADLNYSNNDAGICLIEGSVPVSQSGTYDQCGGTLVNNWSYTDFCGNTINATQNIIVNPAPAPVFINEPTDLTLDCSAFDGTVADLNYTNNLLGSCEILGSVPGIVLGTHDACGGSYSVLWETTDECGNYISADQEITILEASEAALISPPVDITVSCDAIPSSYPDLDYTNNESGNCAIMGTIVPTVLEIYDVCGGTIEVEWNTIDPCGRPISATQVITVEPATIASFINPPNDMTVDCDMVPINPTSLDLTNGEIGACLISETVAPIVDDQTDMCGGTITYTWEYTDLCDRTISHVQVLTVNPAPVPTLLNPPADITVDCDNFPTTIADISYDNGLTGDCAINGQIQGVESPFDVCIGQIVRTWSGTDECGNDLEWIQTITVDPIPAVNFENTPADITVSCANAPGAPSQLTYTNNGSGACLIDGFADGTQSGTYDACGGELLNEWTATTSCGEDLTYTQTITIEPAPPPTFQNVPADITVDCDAVSAGIDLMYTNNETGSCLIEGLITPIESGTYDACGGSITYTWSFIDICGNMATEVQVITVNPAPVPDFINLPNANVTVACADFDGTVTDLEYTNGLTGNCELTGFIPGIISGNHDACGGTYNVLWEDIDACGNALSFSQEIIVEPAPEAIILNEPLDITIDCANIPSTFDPIAYDNGETGDCAINGTIDPVVNENYDICGGTIEIIWTDVDLCNRSIEAIQTITVEPAPEASYLNLPTDITVACDMVPVDPPNLDYSNGVGGDCEIMGTSPAIVDDQSDFCGGTITYYWEFTDDCGRTIEHNQTLTINPTPEPTLINAPSDITVDCDNLPGPLADIAYSNGLTGICALTGTISGTEIPFDICTGIIERNWEGIDECGNILSHSQTITVSPIDPIMFVNEPDDITVSCENVPGLPGPLTYSNNGSGICSLEGTVQGQQVGTVDICGGTIQNIWTVVTDCGETLSKIQTITVEPVSPAFYLNIPNDVTVDCENIPSADDLIYTNGSTGMCIIEGATSPTISGSFNTCGGELTYTWMFEDDCDNLIEAEQVITVLPAPIPYFENPPTAITVDCQDYSNNPPDLLLTNGLSGSCPFSTFVAPITIEDVDICGGTTTHFWSYTDMCGNDITTSQIITINPTEPANWINPPADITLSCGEIHTPPGPLMYSNEISGICGISGSSDPILIQDENQYTYIWTFTDPCTGENFNATQIITEIPDIDLLIDPTSATICAGDIYNLGDINVVNLNGDDFVISYYEGNSSSTGTLLDVLFVNPTMTTTYTIVGENEFGCVDEINFTLNVDDPVNAGTGINLDICEDGTINLFDGLTGFYDTGGDWIDESASGVNLDNPNSVSFMGVEPGMYIFTYLLESDNSCPSDDTEVSVTIYPKPIIQVDSINCDIGGDVYSVFITNDIDDIVVSSGTINVLPNGQIEIIDIPVDNTLVITATDPSGNCQTIVTINPPDCDCPTVPPPVFIQDYEICFGDVIPFIEVTPGANTIINWYNMENGGIPFLENASGFIPDVSAVGVYTYYAEAVHSEFPECESFIRVPVVLEILPLPQSQNYSTTLCAPYNCVEPLYDIFEFIDELTSNSNNNIVVYGSEDDRQNETNEIDPTTINTCEDVHLFAYIVNSKNCKSEAELIVDVSYEPEIILSPIHETCDGENDGQIGIVVNTLGGNYSMLLNEVLISNTTLITDLIPGEYTIEVIDIDSECSSSQTVTINPGQEIQILNLNYSCDNLGTDTDPDDDIINLSFIVSSENSTSTTFELFFNGESQGTYTYDEILEFNLPAQGQNIIIDIVDLMTNCTETTEIGPLNPCSTNCDLSLIEYIQFCDDNGTSSFPGDDTIIITINVTAINGSTGNTYNVWINGNPIYEFMYGQPNSFSLAANGNTPSIVVIDSDDNQCSISLPVEPLLSCSDECLIEMEVGFECNINGTIDDIDDDFYTIDISLDHLNTATNDSFYVYIADTLFGVFEYPDASFVLPANSENVTIEVVDFVQSDCTAISTIGPLVPCSSNCTLNVIYQDYFCDDNGTPYDNSDDVIIISFAVSAVDGSADSLYQINRNNVFIEFGTFNDTIVYEFPANGQSIDFDFIDNSEDICITSLSFGPLDPCSNECFLDIESIIYDCDPNGTFSIAEDDFYTVDINLENINTAVNDSFDVYLDGVFFGSFEYDNFSFTIDTAFGQFVTILIVDSEDPDCNVETDIGPLNPCSDECFISIIDIDYTCDINGTADNVDDDFYIINLELANGNTAANDSFQVFLDGVFYDKFEYPLASFEIDANGQSVEITVVDDEDPDCSDSVTIGPLIPCSSDCSLLLDYVTFECNDNGTLLDPTDDFYEYVFVISAIDGSADSMYIVNIDGVFQENGVFNDTLYLEFDANSQVTTIQFVDNTESFCILNYDTEPLTPCSDECLLEVDIVDIYCDNAGTNNTDADDVFYVILNVSNTNTTDNWMSSEPGIEGAYGQDILFGPFLISSGNINLTIFDTDNDSCPIDISLIAPATCSMCEQTLDAGPVINLDCDMPTGKIMAVVSEPGMVSWTGPGTFVSTNLNPNVSAAGWYYIEVLFDDGCSLTDSVEVILNGEIPQVEAGPDELLTCLIDEVFLTGEYLGSFTVEYNWLDENGMLLSTTPDLTVNAPGVYYFQVIDTDNNCVSALDSVVVTDLTNEPSAVIYADPDNILNCAIGVIQLTTDNEVNVIYTWSSEEFNFVGDTLFVNEAGFVNLVALDTLSGCFSLDSIEILDLEEFPNIQLEPIDLITCDITSVNVDASSTFPNTGVVTYWYNEQNEIIDSSGLTFTIDEEGVYYIEVVDTATGCSDIDTFEIFSNLILPDIIGGDDVTFNCIQTDTILEITSNGTGYDYVWSTNNGQIIGANNGESVTAGSTGTYFVEVINPINNCSIFDTIQVNLTTNVPSILEYNTQDESCYLVSDGYISFDGIIGGTEPYSIFVDGEEITEDEISSLAPGTYDIEVIDALGCSLDTTFVIEAAIELSINHPNELTIEVGEEEQIIVTTNIPTDEIDTIIWDPTEGLSCTNCLDPFILGDEITSYTVTIIDIYGCSISGTIFIRLEEDITIYVPNIFSPNGDLTNDGFTVFSQDVERIIDMKIFDRWGELIWEDFDFPPNMQSLGWDGTFNGRPVDNGVFAYIIHVELKNGSPMLLQGDVAVVR